MDCERVLQAGVPLAQADINPPVDTRAVNKTLGYKQWNVTSLVQAWFSNPSTNFGLLLNSDPSKAKDRYEYFASMRDSSGRRPYLEVTYYPQVVYFNEDFENGTIGALSVYTLGGVGSCVVTSEAARTGTRSVKCVVSQTTGGGAALWYRWGVKPGEPANLALAEPSRLYQKFSVLFAPGSFANVINGGSSQFKVLFNRILSGGSADTSTGGWFMTSWGTDYGPPPPTLKNNMAGPDPLYGNVDWLWPYSLTEGTWYDIVTWYWRDATTRKGHVKMWVNGQLITDSDTMAPEWGSVHPEGYSGFGNDST